jgi:hypothetical protein
MVKPEFQANADPESRNGDTTVILRITDFSDLPVLKTPWVYSGPQERDLSRIVATPLPDNSGYVLSHVVRRRRGLLLGTAQQTDIEGSCDWISAMNQMQGFLMHHREATAVFMLSLERHIDFRQHASNANLRYDWRWGFVYQSVTERQEPALAPK